MTFPVTIEEAVRWGEMDAFQHLNNVYFFRLFENVRIRYFMAANILAPDISLGIGPILAETSCRYRAPVTFPATLKISARTSKVYSSGIIHAYEIRIKETDVLAATGEARTVIYDYRSGQISKITDEMLAALSRLEGRPMVLAER